MFGRTNTRLVSHSHTNITWLSGWWDLVRMVVMVLVLVDVLVLVLVLGVMFVFVLPAWLCDGGSMSVLELTV